MKFAKKNFTILCDDVREEKGGQFSLIGLYEKNLLVNNIPAVLPRLCLVILLTEIKESINRVHITFESPKNETLNVEFAGPPKLKGEDTRFTLTLSPFKINEIGIAKFEIKFNDEKKANIVHTFTLKKSKKKSNK